jgi:ABC-type transport system involved in cytochrome c biogenesis permease subunit
VDRGHPQWPDLSIFFFFFFGSLVCGETNKDLSPWPLGWIAVIPSGQIYLFFFFFFYSFVGNVAGGGWWVAALFAEGGQWVIYLVA